MNLQELDTLIRAILVDIKPYRDGDDDCEECFVELTELLYRIENVLSSKPVDAFLEKMLHLEFREVGEFYGFLPIAEEFY
jgi:hypothetical protein